MNTHPDLLWELAKARQHELSGQVRADKAASGQRTARQRFRPRASTSALAFLVIVWIASVAQFIGLPPGLAPQP